MSDFTVAIRPHTLGTLEKKYEVLGTIFPNTFCSLVDIGEGDLKAIAYSSVYNCAGVAQRKSVNDCSAYETGDIITITHEGIVDLQYIATSGTIAKTGFIVSNTGVNSGVAWCMVNVYANLPSFLTVEKETIYLDPVYGYIFLEWSDEVNRVGKVLLRGIDHAR